MSRLRLPPRGDEGASLILAMIFITSISLVIGALLNFGSSSVIAAKALRDRSQADYDVDAALQAAINNVRKSSYNNAPSEVCLAPAAAPTQNYVDVPTSTGGTIRVFCAPATGSGAAAGLVPISSANKPGSAILTLGTSASEPGIKLGSNGTLTVKGDIRMNSTLSPGGAGSALAMLGGTKAYAKQSCGGVTVTPAGACVSPYTPGADASFFLDPGTVAASATAYADPPTAVSDLTYRPVPACGSSPIAFDPGYYDDAVKLSALTNGGCSGKTFWFKPGRYYFDFHNKEGGGGIAAGGTDLWTVNDSNARVVAGTPNGWTTSPFTAPTIPGSCISPLTSTTSGQGVQFVFGGDSRLSIVAGQMEICGQYYSNKPSLAIHGMKAGANPSSTTLATKTNGSGTTPASAVAFTPFSDMKETDDKGAIATLASVNAVDTTASVATTDFSTAALPAGSMVTSAQLLVRHRETITSGTLQSLKVSGSFDTGGTPTALAATNLTVGSAFHNDLITVTPSAATISRLHAGTAVVSKAQVDAVVGKTAGTANNAKVEIDSIQLVYTYTPPAVRGQQTDIAGAANCIGTVPYTSNCALITTSGAQARLYVQGTSYTPLAALDIQLTNASSQVFRAGLIARALAIKVTASATYTGPVIELPDDSPGFASAPLQVYFTAAVCPAAGCPSSPPTTAAGRAKVAFTDTTISPVPGQRKVTVNAWQLPR